MIKEINQKSSFLFSLFFIPAYMLCHIYYFNDFSKIVVSGKIQFQSELINTLYQTYFKWGYFSYVLLGLFFWIKPKIMFPLCLLIYWLIQAPLMNKLNWHDQHVAFLLMLSLMISHFTTRNIPIRQLTILFLTMFFFGAGVGKLTVGGIEWLLDGRTAQFRFLEYYIMFDMYPGLFIAERLWLCKTITWITILFEVGIPICLVFKKTQASFMAFSFIFLTMIYLTMKINFFIFLVPVYTIFLPWDKLSILVNKQACRKLP